MESQFSCLSQNERFEFSNIQIFYLLKDTVCFFLFAASSMFIYLKNIKIIVKELKSSLWKQFKQIAVHSD